MREPREEVRFESREGFVIVEKGNTLRVERKAQEPGDFYSDITRIESELGWRPTVELGDGLARTVAYYEGCREVYWDQPAVAVAP